MQAPFPLRAHMAICLLGFRGSGYSPAFVEAMAALQSSLRTDPERVLELVDAPEAICAACPNLAAGGCTLGGREHEAHMRAHDREVLRRLELEPRSRVSWRDLLTRVGAHIQGSDLAAICTTCPWLPLGVCRQSVDALREGRPSAGEAH